MDKKLKEMRNATYIEILELKRKRISATVWNKAEMEAVTMKIGQLNIASWMKRNNEDLNHRA